MAYQEFGLIHIYCGNGKGKTTAALGLAVRAAGRGKKVRIARFLKTEDSGEVPVLRKILGIDVLPCEKNFGFTFQMDDEVRRKAALYHDRLFERAIRDIQDVDLLILDEVIGACGNGLVEKGKLEMFLDGKPEALEVVLTGRRPWKEIIGRADYVTEMEPLRHPFERGIGAREGIEY